MSSPELEDLNIASLLPSIAFRSRVWLLHGCGHLGSGRHCFRAFGRHFREVVVHCVCHVLLSYPEASLLLGRRRWKIQYKLKVIVALDIFQELAAFACFLFTAGGVWQFSRSDSGETLRI